MFYTAIIRNKCYYRRVKGQGDQQQLEAFSEAVFNITGQRPNVRVLQHLPDDPQLVLIEI